MPSLFKLCYLDPIVYHFLYTGPQITPPHDKNILLSINQNLQPKEGQTSFSEDLTEFKGNLMDTFDFVNGYYDTLKDMVYDDSMNSKFNKKIVYSAMHGSISKSCMLDNGKIH